MRNVETTLHDRLASLITAMGYEFVGCEIVQGQGSLLRIYVDSEAGVTVDDCSKVSRQVSAMLDVEEPLRDRYRLEVSSPGLDRPLFEVTHYQKYIGSQVKVRLYHPIDNRRNFAGLLLRVNETEIHLQVDSVDIVLPFSDIEKANLVN